MALTPRQQQEHLEAVGRYRIGTEADVAAAELGLRFQTDLPITMGREIMGGEQTAWRRLMGQEAAERGTIQQLVVVPRETRALRRQRLVEYHQAAQMLQEQQAQARLQAQAQAGEQFVQAEWFPQQRLGLERQEFAAREGLVRPYFAGLGEMRLPFIEGQEAILQRELAQPGFVGGIPAQRIAALQQQQANIAAFEQTIVPQIEAIRAEIAPQLGQIQQLQVHRESYGVRTLPAGERYTTQTQIDAEIAKIRAGIAPQEQEINALLRQAPAGLAPEAPAVPSAQAVRRAEREAKIAAQLAGTARLHGEGARRARQLQATQAAQAAEKEAVIRAAAQPLRIRGRSWGPGQR